MEKGRRFAREERAFDPARKAPRRARHYLGARLRCGAMLVCVIATVLLNLSQVFASQQVASHQDSKAVTVEGVVRDTSGQPLSGANMILEEKGSSTTHETQTGSDGTFAISSDHAGTFTLRVKKAGFADTVADALVLSLGDKRHLDLVLEPPIRFSSAPESAPASLQAMEFKDEPSFTVAGVTDWTNLGLHGSAVSSQTSEALAKQTSTLKSSEPEATAAGTSAKRYEVALARRDKGDLVGARDQVRNELARADDADGHRLLGELDERLNEPLEAVREYEKAVRMNPSEQNYFEWGSELLLHKAAQPAVEVFAKGATVHPKSARMLTGLGAALYATGSYEDAAHRLCEASDLMPSDTASYVFLGKIEKATPETLPCSEQRLARFANEQPRNALANYYYAISIWKRAKNSANPLEAKEAEELLEKAVNIDPRLDVGFLQLGILHSARGDFERAIADCKKAIAVNPNLGEGHRQLGLAYQRTGDTANAQREFQSYDLIAKKEAAELDQQRRELGQFLVILKEQPGKAPPH